MKKIFNKFSLTENIVILISFIAYTICAFFINSIDGWIAWASCITYLVFLVLNANSKYISFIWIIISFLIYIYFNIKEMYWGELTLSIVSILINIIAMFQWKKYTKNEQLEINKLKNKEIIFSSLITIIFGIAIYFILWALNSNQILLNAIILSITLLEYYLTFRRTYWKFIAGIISVTVYIILWSMSLNTSNNFALLFVINGGLNMFWFFDGIYVWRKIQKNNASKK